MLYIHDIGKNSQIRLRSASFIKLQFQKIVSITFKPKNLNIYIYIFSILLPPYIPVQPVIHTTVYTQLIVTLTSLYNYRFIIDCLLCDIILSRGVSFSIVVFQNKLHMYILTLKNIHLCNIYIHYVILM